MQRRWNPNSSSDEDDDRWPCQTEPMLKRRRKLLVVDEEEADDSGGEEVADEDMEVLKPIGEVVRVSGSGGRKINHYKAFDFAGNIYKLGDSVLMSPENETQKPYVAIIKLAACGLPLTPEALAALPTFSSITFNDVNDENCKPEVAKTGLGSSAAMTSAVVAALLHYLGAVNLLSSTRSPCNKSNSNKDLDLVHIIAQTSHCIAQGKVGSGFDVSSAVYGSQHYVRFSPDVISSAQDSFLASLNVTGCVLPLVLGLLPTQSTPFVVE